MCANCVMGAATAAAGATGLRVWLAARVTAGTLRRASLLLVVLGVLGAGIVGP